MVYIGYREIFQLTVSNCDYIFRLRNFFSDPVFHQSFSIGDYIYFFFDEFGLDCADCDPVRFSRVSRICKV